MREASGFGMLPGGRSLEKMEMDANSGEPWSEMDIADLAYSLACDGTIRGHGEVLLVQGRGTQVRQKARQLGLIERARSAAISGR